VVHHEGVIGNVASGPNRSCLLRYRWSTTPASKC